MPTPDGKGYLLLVEDEHNLARYLQLELENEGFSADIEYDGLSGLEKALTIEYDLILLDVMLPELSGIELCRRIRETKDVPIIMITARGEVPDIVTGLDSGANDYLAKPFAIEELFARIRALLRQRETKATQEIVVGRLRIQPNARRVFLDEEEIMLTPREFDLLYYLVQNKEQAVSREQILTAVWGFDFMGNTNIVDVYIRYLRNKIETDPSVKLIHTVRGIGYTLRD
ncbi:response regulator transcription factor [Brevibacillus formosus]|uniref:PhoB family transcriptional regulator n=1 Tax=Brevibacillus formosus TaxID=54913 RepID=A0A837KR06_9BACL|nr:response regulator transcription factor [Brevibacillus formosus]KLI00159.1 PhoB family transcriptional regulator [Brevibacillus formosus]MED1959237.1 response regulator transcription factor [Brevibacillus formosus]PSJ97415.1 DNA-binding response regulator [Brevibacillus formosus]GED56607.1 putative transcriptional regulatory protein YkoG [Brevibacillus formosus]